MMTSSSSSMRDPGECQRGQDRLLGNASLIGMRRGSLMLEACRSTLDYVGAVAVVRKRMWLEMAFAVLRLGHTP